MQKYEKEINRLERQILKDWDKRTPRKGKEYRTVGIVPWEADDNIGPCFGLRIAEITFCDYPNGRGTLPCHGSSFMQCDTSIAIMAAERLILDRVHFGGGDEEIYSERLFREIWDEDKRNTLEQAT